MPASILLALPAEIIEQILSQLPANDLYEAAATCKSLNSICNTQGIWRKLCFSEYNCIVQLFDPRTYYKTVLQRFGKMLGRYYISAYNQKLLKYSFDPETENILVTTFLLPTFRTLFEQGIEQKIACICFSERYQSGKGILKEGSLKITCLASECTFRRIHQLKITINNNERFALHHYNLQNVPTTSIYQSLPVWSRSHECVIKDGYFTGVRTGMITSKLSIYHIHNSNKAGNGSVVFQFLRGSLHKFDTIEGKFINAVKINEDQQSGAIRFARASLELCLEWRLKGSLSNKQFNLRQRFLYMPPQTTQTTPDTYQCMLRAFNDHGSDEEADSDCILIIFDADCIGVLHGKTIYLYRRLAMSSTI